MTEGNFSVKSERLQNQNVVNIRAGPGTFAASRIIEGCPVSSFRPMFSEPMIRMITKYAIAEDVKQKITIGM